MEASSETTFNDSSRWALGAAGVLADGGHSLSRGGRRGCLPARQSGAGAASARLEEGGTEAFTSGGKRKEVGRRANQTRTNSTQTPAN